MPSASERSETHRIARHAIECALRDGITSVGATRLLTQLCHRLDLAYAGALLLRLMASDRSGKALDPAAISDEDVYNVWVGYLLSVNRISEALHLERSLRGYIPGTATDQISQRSRALWDMLSKPTSFPAQPWFLKRFAFQMTEERLLNLLSGSVRRIGLFPGLVRAAFGPFVLVRVLRWANRFMTHGAIQLRTNELRGGSYRTWPERTRSAVKAKPVLAVRYNYDTVHMRVTVQYERDGDIVTRQHFPGMYAQFRETNYRDGPFSGMRGLNNAIFSTLVSIQRREPKAYAMLEYIWRNMLSGIYGNDEKAWLRSHEERTLLVLSLFGSMRLLPIAAFYDGHQHMVDLQDIVYADTDTDVDTLSIEGGPGLTKPARLLIAVAGGESLPSAAQETHAIAPLARSRGHAVTTLSGRWSGDDLLDALKHATIVHLVTHFHDDPHDVGECLLQVGDGSLCKVQQMLDADLSHIELMVLSGCATSGWTEWYGGSGRSLIGALRKAGVRAIVATLWPVSDAAAHHFAHAFYQALFEGHTKARAVALGQFAVSRTVVAKSQLYGVERKIQADAGPDVETKDDDFKEMVQLDAPYYWGPFFMTGDWVGFSA